MSNLIPPMPSSTPPPLDDNLEEDDDEEFGDFAGVDSCYSHEEVTSVPRATTWEVNEVKMCNGDNTSQDSVQSGATDSGLCSAGEERAESGSAGEERAESGDDKNGSREVTDNLGSSSPTCQDSIPNSATISSNFVSHNHLEDPGGKTSIDPLHSVNISDDRPDTDISNSEVNSSNIYDFNDLLYVGKTDGVMFNGSEMVDQSKHSDNLESVVKHYDVSMKSTDTNLKNSELTVNSSSINIDDDFGDFTDAECDLPVTCSSQNESWGDFHDKDDFANFEQYSSSADDKDLKISNHSQNWACSTSTQIKSNLSLPDEDDDDFEDFETAGPSNTGPQEEPHLLLHESPTDVVTMLFPVVNSVYSSKAVSPVTILNSAVWCHLRDLETSNALSYQWAGSAANRLLLSSLAIDARNILFGPRWNSSVPRFAANLGLSPLEPVRSVRVSGESSTSQHSPSSSDVKPEDVPAAQFDWSVSGLVNPLDSPESAVRTPGIPKMAETAQSTLSPEAQRVLSSLPDLSFLRARMLMFPVRGIDSPARAH